MTVALVPPGLPRGAVLSHCSAALAWGLPLLGDAEAVEVTLPRSRSRWATTTAVVHRRDLLPAEIAVVDGRLVTSPMRTVLDLASVLPLTHAVSAADHALAGGLIGIDELWMATAATRGRSAARWRALAPLVDARAESALESVLRVVLTLGGLCPPASQYEIRDGRFVARVDFGWPELRLAVEADGFAFHSDRDSYRRDRARANALELLGWSLLSFTWEQIMHQPAYVVATVRAKIELLQAGR